MARFCGRAHDSLTIPSKPIPTGFKIWALGQQGYLLHWIWHQKNKGPVEVKPPKLPKPHAINPTNSVVVACLKSLPVQPYCVWLDNLFVSKNLMTYLREEGFSAAGTATTKSGVSESMVKRKQAEKNKDIYEWGTLFTETADNSQVKNFQWKDNALLIFQSTAHTGKEDAVTRNRKRPSKTSSKAKTACQPFGDSPRKELPIPAFIDEYNHFMNQVDQADQLRSYNSCIRPITKGWKALFFFLFQTMLVNAYLLSFHSESPSKFTKSTTFRSALYQSLLQKSERLTVKGEKKRTRSELSCLPDNYATSHERGRISDSPGNCQVCLHGKKQCLQANRSMLGESSGNIQLSRPKRSRTGCIACNVPICSTGLCWEVFHSLEE